MIRTALSPADREFLESCRVGRLATADASGAPHVVPFCYALVGDALYFVVDEKPKAKGRTLKRLRNIAENPRVAVVVDLYDEDWSRLDYLLVRGRAAVVEERGEFERALEGLRARYPQYRAMRLEYGRNALVRITVEKANRWRAA